MTLENAKICRDCGCLCWDQPQSCVTARYGKMGYYPNNANGEYNEEFERSDDDGDYNDDWNDDGNPMCNNCQSTDLKDIDFLTREQFSLIYHLEDSLRCDAITLMEENKDVDPETGEELAPLKHERKNKRARLIGREVRQR